MRTITEKLANRLKIQSKEAKVQGMTKLAEHLDNISNVKTRKTGTAYVYAEADLKSDVEGHLWNAIVRIADYYDCNIDAGDVYPILKSLGEDMTDMIAKQAGINHGVGVFEPSIPGEEVAEEVLLEVK